MKTTRYIPKIACLGCGRLYWTWDGAAACARRDRVLDRMDEERRRRRRLFEAIEERKRRITERLERERRSWP